MRVLFVCTGNICRSPTAEGILRAQWSGIVDSAGIMDYHTGAPPDARTTATAKARGVDLSALRARQVSVADFDRFDYLLGMDASHVRALRALQPKPNKAVVERFLDMAGLGGDVPDPYYGTQADFEAVYSLIADGVTALLPRLRTAG